MKKSNNFHQRLKLAVISFIALFFSSCLISEYDEYHIVLNADNSGTISITKRNLQSDQIDIAKQQEDFDNLISDWKEDQYLLEKTKEEVYVKDRKLSIVKGKLVWQEVAIFADLHRLFRDVIVNDTMRIGFGKDETVVATNGELIRTKDSTFVQWPLKTREFILKIQKNNFTPVSNFAEKFKAYSKKKK
jgi:hypothetical protein